MRFALAPVFVLLVGAAPLPAQAGASIVPAGFSGTWVVDPIRSDSFPGGRFPGGCFSGGRGVLVPRDMIRQGNFPARGPGNPGPILDRRIIEFLDEIRLFERLTLTIDDSAVIVSNGPKYKVRWQIDGRRHQVAQMEGGVVEFEASWNSDAMVLERRISDCRSTLRREFRLKDDGSTLQVQLEISSPGSKTKKRFVYARASGETAP